MGDETATEDADEESNGENDVNEEANGEEGDHMVYEKKMQKQEGGDLPAMILAPFKRLLNVHLQRILFAIKLWFPFPSFTAKSVTFAYPPESVEPLKSLAEIEDNGEQKVKKIFAEGKWKKYGMLIMKDALKKGDGTNIPPHIEDIMQKLIDINLDQAKKLAKENA